MRVLLTAVNAKYIHSNLAVYSLKVSAREYESCVELAEYTINHQPEQIFADICRRKPDLLLFSCYIWNRREVVGTAENIRKVLPDTVIWAGGPEVSWDAPSFLMENPQFDGVMTGEGERTFFRLLQYYVDGIGTLGEIAGIAWRERDGAWPSGSGGVLRQNGARLSGSGAVLKRDDALLPSAASDKEIAPEDEGSGRIRQNPQLPPEPTLDHLPFVYGDLTRFENRILYYESSRGCPFSCSYCLSSLEKTVRFRSLPLVKEELLFFLRNKVPQVKFVDRTFNCSHAHAMEIWRFLLENDNGVTNFHFEISADLLTKEEIALLARMRPGLVQLEIGVQTVNREALRAIRRTAPFEKIAENVRAVARAHNIRQHLDLIAGLPYEDYESFGRSFDAVYALRPQELQLGFLKVLRGSEMHKRAREYGILYRSDPPYEVLQTKWISCEELLYLKDIEEMTEVYYNSRQFGCTMEALVREYGRPFALYEALASFYRARGEGMRSYTRIQRLELLREFIREAPQGKSTGGKAGKKETAAERAARYDRLLLCDLYLRENAKTRPAWAESQKPWKDEIFRFYRREEQERRYLAHYEGRTWKQLMKMTHLERWEGGTWLLFDYERRDPLDHAASVYRVTLEQDGADSSHLGKEI